jgi:hypothetical protein
VLQPASSSPVTTNSDFSGPFNTASNYGYTIESIYTYNAGTGQTWKEDEHLILRDWLDTHGHADVKVAFNARAGTSQLTRPVIEAQGIECDLTSFNDNKGGRFETLQWMATNSATAGEQFGLHCHCNFAQGVVEPDGVGRWVWARRTVRNVARDILNTPAMLAEFRTNRMTFAFFAADFSDPTEMLLLPETQDGGTYGETYTGLLLSIIEQRAWFEGLLGGFPTDADCENFARGYSYTAVADGSLTNASTWAVPLPGSDDINSWFSGAHTVGAHGAADNATVTFNGGALNIGTNGTLDAHANGTTLKLRSLQLSGGVISQVSGSGTFKLDLTNENLTLNSGTLMAGGTAGQNLQFSRAALAGKGTIAVTAAGVAGNRVIFDDTVNPNGFRGTFDVKSNGVLRLPAVPVAAFGMKLSGTGKFVNDANVTPELLT